MQEIDYCVDNADVVGVICDAVHVTKFVQAAAKAKNLKVGDDRIQFPLAVVTLAFNCMQVIVCIDPIPDEFKGKKAPKNVKLVTYAQVCLDVPHHQSSHDACLLAPAA